MSPDLTDCPAKSIVVTPGTALVASAAHMTIRQSADGVWLAVTSCTHVTPFPDSVGIFVIPGDATLAQPTQTIKPVVGGVHDVLL
jgi:hypothetical protein